MRLIILIFPTTHDIHYITCIPSRLPALPATYSQARKEHGIRVFNWYPLPVNDCIALSAQQQQKNNFSITFFPGTSNLPAFQTNPFPKIP
jgi:hypothetical protein